MSDAARDRRGELAEQANEFAAQFQEWRTLNINDWFYMAMARNVQQPIPMDMDLPTLNLGAGYRMIGGSIPLDIEHGWFASEGLQEYPNEGVGGIWAHGFFEHIPGEEAVRLLRECERVLHPGCPLNIVVPHGLSNLHAEDITHQSRWHEDTFRNLFDNPYYDAAHVHTWKLRVHTQFIMGVKWDNLALFTQLVKER